MIYSTTFPNSKNQINTLFLHGAGQADSSRYFPLAEKLAQLGFGSFLFDFPGHGKSTGQISDSSLQIRLQTAQKMIAKIDSKKVNLIAFSMSGHLAIKLLEKNFDRIENLILFCPAVYSKDAFEVNFGPDFSEIIRRQDSWKNNDLGPLLNKFSGKLLIIIGQNDEVIPLEVIRFIFNKASKSEVLELVGVPHLIGKWMNQDSNNLELIVSKVVKSLSETKH